MTAARGPIAIAALTLLLTATAALADEPLVLAREGYFYVGGHYASYGGKTYMTGQMYVEYRIPAKEIHPYPVVMVHGGTMSGTNYVGTPDGREGWAQHFVRMGYAVYVVDQPGRGRSSYLEAAYGKWRNVDRDNAQSRFISQEKSKLWPQAVLHTQWPGDGSFDDPAVQQLVSQQLPAIADFSEQQALNRDALVALLDRIGPAVILVHSQGGAFAWPVADARPALVKAILGIEPNGPPVHDIVMKGAPEWFADKAAVKPWGLGEVPITYAPAVSDASPLEFVREDKADGPDLARCWLQKAPARQLPNLQKMPILVLTSEASYHAPYDHCTVKYLEQAGVHPSFIRLADVGIRGNSHVMMLEKNSAQIAEVIEKWLATALGS